MNTEKEFIADLLNPKTQNTAFSILLKQYQKPLYSLIRNIVINHDDANDVLQNTFIKIFQNLKNFKHESKLFTWLYRIATNEAITYMNIKSKKYNVTSEELQLKIINKLESDVFFDGDEIQLKLHKAIAQLPFKQQIVFKMKYFDSLTYEQIAEITYTSVGALKASYFHAVKKIEHFLMSN